MNWESLVLGFLPSCQGHFRILESNVREWGYISEIFLPWQWTNNPDVWKWHDLSQQSMRTCLCRRLSPFSYTSFCSLVPPAWPQLRAVLEKLIFAAVLQIITLNITFPRWTTDTGKLKECKHSYYAFTVFLQGFLQGNFPISSTLLS